MRLVGQARCCGVEAALRSWRRAAFAFSPLWTRSHARFTLRVSARLGGLFMERGVSVSNSVLNSMNDISSMMASVMGQLMEFVRHVSHR